MPIVNEGGVAVSLAPRAWRHQGVLLGLLVLGTQNGLPFFDTTQHFVFGYAISNYMALALIALLIVRIPGGSRKRGTGAMALVGYLLVIWWFVTLWHSVGNQLAPVCRSVGTSFCSQCLPSCSRLASQTRASEMRCSSRSAPERLCSRSAKS